MPLGISNNSTQKLKNDFSAGASRDGEDNSFVDSHSLDRVEVNNVLSNLSSVAKFNS